MQPAIPSRPATRWPHLVPLLLLPAWWRASSPLPPSLVLAAWLLLCAGWFAAWEIKRPHRDDWRPNRDDLTHDGSVISLVVIADAALSALIALIAARYSAGQLAIPLPAQVALGVVIAEFGSYWIHRLSHRGGWLWRVHLLHHRPQRVNLANALTAHPLNALYDKLVRMAPLYLLGLHADAILLVALFGLTQTLAVHTNMAGGLGWLDYLIGGPGLHRMHHSTRYEEAGNFGTTIPLWDHVFGTFRKPGSPGEVGLFDATPYPGEHETMALLRYPFSCGKSCRLHTLWLAARARCC